VKTILAITLILAGCATTPVPDPVPTAGADALDKIGKSQDKIDGRVAAGLVAIETNAEKPAVVKAEAKLAQAYLPPASEGDKAFALARAAAQDQKAYVDQTEYARKFLSKLTSDWEKAEVLAQRNALEIANLKAENRKLKEDVIRIEKESDRKIWTITGAALVVFGGVAMAFAGIKKGAPLLLAGAFAGAVPYVIDSPWFTWICGSAGAVLAGLLIWVAYDKARDTVNEPPSPQQP
jgi:hypothetical protein